MPLIFRGVVSFEGLFHEHNCSMQVGFVSTFLAYSILYKVATTWLQEELNLAVRVQNEVTISDASLILKCLGKRREGGVKLIPLVVFRKMYLRKRG